MIRRLAGLGLAGLGLAVGVALAPVQAQAASPRPIAREVLVLYNSAEQISLRGQNLLTASETILNHLGLIVRYWDLAQGLPEPALSARVRGVISLLNADQVPGADAYAHWLSARLAAEQPVMILGGLGFLRDARTGASTPATDWQPLTEALGLHYDGSFLGDPHRIKVVSRSPATDFERPWHDPLTNYAQATATPAAHEILLRLARTDTGAQADEAVLGPHGAIVLGAGTLVHVNPFSYHLQWRIDPVHLFGQGLHLAGLPRFDTTTLNGRRIFYAQIDGDGFSNVADLPGRPLAAASIRDTILRRTALPTSVSVIAREIQPSARNQQIARSIFALPNVEGASHSFTHPFDWKKATEPLPGAISDVSEGSEGEPAHGTRIPLSPRHEIDDAVRYIQTLLPPGKRVELMLWSGKTNPPAPFLAATARLGIANLNGGDAHLDKRLPSLADLAPLARQVGPFVQPYASVANENLFTNLWTGPFDGQLAALATFRFAGAPWRMTPVDIYYHFYAGERAGGLRALETLYRWAASQPLAPVYASRYARIVDGFYHAEMSQLDARSWHFSHVGACRTVRFDDEARTPDLGRSEHVAGFARLGHTLYVHLSADDATLVLGNAPDNRPYLEEASGPLVDWQASSHRLQAAFQLDAPGSITLAGFAPHQPIRLTGLAAGGVGADGRLHLTAARGPVRIEVAW